MRTDNYRYRIGFVLIVFILTTLATLAAPARAQSSADWPPDPKALFAKGIQVVTAELVTPPPPLIEVDSEARLIRLANGKEYPWPRPESGVEFVNVYLEEEDQTVIIDNAVYLAVETSDKKGYSTWRLDLTTGEYDPYPSDTFKTPCGERILGSLDRSWVFFTDPETKQTYLCELATGKLHGPLPEGYDWDIEVVSGGGPLSDMTVPIVPSPDKSQLAFFGNVPNSFKVVVFSYALISGKLLELGNFRASLGFGVVWVDNITLLVSNDDTSTFGVHDTYVAEANQANSLELALSEGPFFDKYYPDPPRLELFFNGADPGIGRGSDTPRDERVSCAWILYYVKTRQKSTFLYPGNMCIPEYGPRDGDAYFRDVRLDRAAPSILVRYNPVTKQRVDLYRDEIEQVLWVSADENYAALALDNDGIIEIEPGWTGAMSNPQFVILNLITGEILFKSEVNSPFSGGPRLYPDDYPASRWSPNVYALSDNTLLLEIRQIRSRFRYQCTKYLRPLTDQKRYRCGDSAQRRGRCPISGQWSPVDLARYQREIDVTHAL